MKQRAYVRVLDFVAYIAISLFVVASMFVSSALNIPPAEYMRWVAATFIGVGVFAFMIGENKPLWHQRKFWIFTGLAALLHCAAAIMMIGRKVNLSGRDVTVVFIIEVGALSFLNKWVFPKWERD